MRLAVAGEGAFGAAHLQALAWLPDAEVTLLIGRVEADTRETATKFSLKHWTTDFDAAIADPKIDAVILATPTPLHAAQAIACLEAGKHVLVEIPMADSLADAERLVRARQKTGRIAMVGHIRRFNAGHAWIHDRIARRALTLRQLVVQTYFLRRTNTNLLGKPRSWTDSLLWHHACHSADLFLYQSGEDAVLAQAMCGPLSSSLGVPMDLAIQLKTPSGKLASISLSFNHDGPQGSTFRYICDEGTYVAYNDNLTDADGQPVELDPQPLSGLQRVDQAFLQAIRDGREPTSSVDQGLPAMRLLDRLASQLA